MHEKIDFKTECKTLPYAELRRIFIENERRQKIIAGIPVWILIPALVVCGFNGYLAGFGAAGLAGGHHIEVGFSIYEFINFVFFAGCGGLMAVKNEKIFYVVPFIMLLDVLLMGIEVVTVIMSIYVIVGCVYMKKVVNNLNFLRSLPGYPFYERQTKLSLKQ